MAHHAVSPRRRLLTHLAAGAALALAMALTAPASAQEQPWKAIAPGGPVTDRPRPDYDARGARAGAFRIYPSIEVGALYDDNAFATDTNKQADAYATLRPEVRVASQWPVHALELSADAFTRQGGDSNQDLSRWSVAARGRLDVTRSAAISADVSYTDGEENLLDNPDLNAAEPAPFQALNGRVEARLQAARARLRVGAATQAVDYEDTQTSLGVPLDQDERDRVVTSADARAEVWVGPAAGVFAEVEANRREFDIGPPQIAASRDSEGVNAALGTVWEFSGLLRGDLGVRYLKQDFDDPAAEAIDDFGALAKITWLPTDLTTVKVRVERRVGDAGVGAASSFLADDYALSVDHELRRNVLLGFEAEHTLENYRGVDREDKRTRAGLGVRYLLNRTASMFLRYVYTTQKSDGFAVGREYDSNAVTLGLRLQL